MSGLWLKRALFAAALLAALYGVDRLLTENLLEYVLRILLLCGINAILAVGLNLINGTTGQFSIGHAGFMAIGAYTTASLVIALENALFPGQAGQLSLGQVALVFTPALIAGALAAALAGVLVGVPSLRLRGDYLAIVTLGFGEIIRLLFNNTAALGGATGYSGERAQGLPVYTSFFWVATWAILVISAAAAGIGGGLFAHLQSTIRPDDFKFDRSIDMVVMIIVGGLGSVTGAVVGAFFVGITLELTRDLSQYRLVVYALMLVLLMLFRPQGLLGARELSLRGLFARRRAQQGGR